MIRILAFIGAALIAAAAEFPAPAADAHKASMHAWERSLIPLVASQVLDAQSSWGKLEANPMLAERNGTFGPRSAELKFGVTGAAVGIQYLIARRSPRLARTLGRMNWAVSSVTIGVAIHNFGIK